jgi:hypothetical protein
MQVALIKLSNFISGPKILNANQMLITFFPHITPLFAVDWIYSSIFFLPMLQLDAVLRITLRFFLCDMTPYCLVDSYEYFVWDAAPSLGHMSVNLPFIW